MRQTIRWGIVQVGGQEWISSRAGRGIEALEGVVGNWRFGGISRFEWVVGEDRDQLVDGAGACKGAGVAVVGEMMADASERLVKVEWVQ